MERPRVKRGVIMTATKLLYSWAYPAVVQGSPVDHTWVTSYDNRINAYPDIAAVEAANEDYWYCWGGFHARGGTPNFPDGSIGSRNGDIILARCLVTSNADSSINFSARGTIFTYGVDGVCHQLANQVLYATGAAGGGQGGGPLTVASARGYMVSLAIYGVYGAAQRLEKQDRGMLRRRRLGGAAAGPQAVNATRATA
jgi:hypothetical protein